MKILKVPSTYNNKKLNTFLLDTFSGLSQSTLYKALRKKDIRINDKRVSENCLLKTGDEIKLFIVDSLLEKKLDIPIVFQDDNIVVFNKPQGIPVTGGSDSLTYYAQKLFSSDSNKFIEPCHRLDMNTIGLVLFARNQTALDLLLDAFKNHTIEKHYICVVCGIPQSKKQKLEAYLFKDSKKSQVYISDTPKNKYQKIITSYSILNINKSKNISQLDILLETGRTHQIRAHLAHIGYPILGDGKYGFNKINNQFKLTYQQLCSYSLTFKFSNNSPLSYLSEKTIKLNNVPFSKFFMDK